MTAFITAVIIILSILASLSPLMSPLPKVQAMLPTEFSSDRAMSHLGVIARAPHPTGSPAQEVVRNYLLGELRSLGVEVEIQETPIVKNILARVRGTSNSQAILLMAHYDSVAVSPGASDDGAAVAVILETLRAITAGAPLRNDLICLFSDGEELGLLGAKAFVYQHRWAKDVRFLLNFDARGSSGPVLMFQTGIQNGWVIRQFAKTAPAPTANSLMPEIYALLPNDTDFTIFKEEGYAGLNFAHLSGYSFYHTKFDRVENLDRQSLDHQGSYALTLARHFGDLDLSQVRSDDVVYFNTVGGVLASYSRRWVRPLAVLISLLFLTLAGLGFARRKLTASGVGIGIIAVLASTISAAGVISLTWYVVKARLTLEQLTLAQGREYTIRLFIVGFACLSVAAVSALYIYLQRMATVEDLTFGALMWWFVLAIPVSKFAPGASYVFQWPLLFSSIGLALVLIAGSKPELQKIKEVLTALCGAPSLILCIPTIYLIVIGLTLDKAAFMGVGIALLFGLLVPIVRLISGPRQWLLPSASALAGISVIFLAS
jgi:hypothetical protein